LDRFDWFWANVRPGLFIFVGALGNSVTRSATVTGGGICKPGRVIGALGVICLVGTGSCVGCVGGVGWEGCVGGCIGGVGGGGWTGC